MASRRFARKPPVSLCSEWGAEDAVEPRLEPPRPSGPVANRKTLQLCRQVERALSLALEGELLRDLTVQAVVPAPDSSRLLATVVFHGPPAIAITDVLAALHSAHDRLRCEIAAAIHRRKTPDLSFCVLRASS